MPMLLSALLSDASMLAISSLSTVFACLKDTKIAFGRNIPVALLGTVSTIAFCSTFLGLLSWVSVVLGHDPEVEEAIVEAQRMIKHRIKQLEDVEGSLECLIRFDRLSNVVYLSPCGHTFDIDCLVSWLRTAHPSDAAEELALDLANSLRSVANDLARLKLFPFCHKLVIMRPVPTLALCGLGIEPPGDLQANPWKAVFTEYRVERVAATGEVSW
ncbi:hypothetical protein C8J57DRAFT_1726457, partial [Mycena rebaudengoi]